MEHDPITAVKMPVAPLPRQSQIELGAGKGNRRLGETRCNRIMALGQCRY